MSLSKKLLILAGAALLLVVSLKFFPYHCKCGPNYIDGTASGAALPADTRTAEVYMGAPVVKIGDTTIRVDISDTPALREKGLSGRESIEDGNGMLFVFEKPGMYGFWMKDMNFPIDIVWINSDNEVIGVEDSLSPDTYPKPFFPIEAVKYVLELPAGYSSQHGIKAGSPFLLIS
jgi:uncharacterized membrane protein (UPF0127 family)